MHSVSKLTLQLTQFVSLLNNNIQWISINCLKQYLNEGGKNAEYNQEFYHLTTHKGKKYNIEIYINKTHS